MPHAQAPPGPTASHRPPGFSCLRSDTEMAACVTVAGELDIAAVPELDRALRHAEAAAALVVLDLRSLDFIDSCGVHLLLATDRRLRRAGGCLAVVRGPAEVDWFLELVGADRHLQLVGEPPVRTRPGRSLERVPGLIQR